ncbi:aminoalcohol phosphotransferase [Trypanosoma grayi]|uniref:aminoalcohol phosphotransferase n=1 Tax=Trypanosoma grayi TaxID=71804 RepID=UPI0004F4B0B5|nr:aminoalcohol phosphotransferase [Trypanosoma grayi]KEG14586.1 aminoalcohol phosphotransferase [Trypanosoma grayi]
MGKWIGGSYLPDNAPERLSEYVYHGTDKSLLYKYIWRPLCVRLVTYLPVWLSANVISVSALAFVFATHLLLAWYVPKLTVKDSLDMGEGDSRFAMEYILSPHPFVFVLAALALLAYPILDNLDGHQARRTRTASPLGLIVDHGCDAFNCVIASLSVASSLSAGPTWKTWALMLSMVIAFFMNTWEEYYIDELVLPLINGPNEGVLVGIIMYFFTAWVGGPRWWYVNGVTIPHSWLPVVLSQAPPLAAVEVEKNVLGAICPWIAPRSTGGAAFSMFPMLLGLNCSDTYVAAPPLPLSSASNPTSAAYIGHSTLQNVVIRLYDTEDSRSVRIRYNTIGILILIVSSAATSVGNMIRVYRAVRQPIDKSKYGSGWLVRNMPFVHALTRLLPLAVITLFATLWFLTSPDNVFRRHPRIFCWTVGLLYTKSAIHLMIAHVCGVEFNPFRRTLWPFLFLSAHMVLTYCRNILHMTQWYQSPSLSLWLRSPTKVWIGLPDEEHVLWALFTLSLLAFVHLVINVVRETAEALGVSIFTVPHSNQEALRKQIEEERAKKHK